MEKVITDNSSEIIKIRWDDTRFILDRWCKLHEKRDIIPLSPPEMLDIVEFVGEIK